mmetsp:Transcript_19582/g.64062  ORF Transcript_19582/g.64062 Transcript_19582/m.64062 type:complete len:370 (+) Transcript_19582:1402-2511(+)
MQDSAGQLLLEQLAKEGVARLLRVDEHQDLPLVVVAAQQLAQPRQLPLRRQHLDVLLDGVRDDRDAARDDLHRLGEYAARQLLDGGGEGGGEEAGLPVGACVADDAVDLRREAKVEHAVRLVEHHVRDALQVGDAAAVCGEHVNHPAWRADDDLGAAPQLGDLLLDAGAAVHRDHADAGEPRELVHLAVDLHGELARRDHDERDRPVVLLERRLVEHVSQHRQRVAHRLAGAGLGDGDDVPALHDRGQRLRLDREGRRVAALLDDGEDGVGEPALRPLLDRLGHALAAHLELVHREARGGDLLVAHALDLRHLDVKVLSERQVGDGRVVDARQLLLLGARHFGQLGGLGVGVGVGVDVRMLRHVRKLLH